MKRALSIIAASLVLGCGHPTTSPATSGATRPRHRIRPVRGVSVGTLEITPGAEHVEIYGAEVEYEPTEVEAALGRRVAAIVPRHDPALGRVAREIASSTPSDSNIPPTLVDGLMAWVGLVDPPPRLIVVEIPDDANECHRQLSGCKDAVSALAAEVEGAVPTDAQLSYGVGVVGLGSGATRMVVAVSEHSVKLEPLAAAIEHGGSIPVSGRLVGKRTQPSVEIVDPLGNWGPVPAVVGDDGSFTSRIDCTGPRGVYQVEILAHGAHGPEVVANFPFYCGVDRPKAIEVIVEELDDRVTPEVIARANFDYLNDARQLRGLSPLVWDDEAARVALGHSRDMVDNGFVGHTSPTTGDVQDRFAAAGIAGGVIRENVARGYGPRGIHDSLMGSPGHRVNMLAEDITHVGIGIVIARPETDAPDAPRPVFATQAFYARPGAGGPPERRLGSELRRKVDALRLARGLRPVGWDDRLSRLANREARAQGKDGTRVDEKELFSLGYAAVERHQAKSPGYEALAGIDLWLRPTLPHVGIGVARIRSADGTGSFVLVVMLGER